MMMADLNPEAANNPLPDDFFSNVVKIKEEVSEQLPDNTELQPELERTPDQHIQEAVVTSSVTFDRPVQRWPIGYTKLNRSVRRSRRRPYRLPSTIKWVDPQTYRLTRPFVERETFYVRNVIFIYDLLSMSTFTRLAMVLNRPVDDVLAYLYDRYPFFYAWPPLPQKYYK